MEAAEAGKITGPRQPVASNGDAPIFCEITFEPAKPKARQVELLRPRRNVEPGQHSGRLLDVFGAHATPVVVLVEAFQSATYVKNAFHRRVIAGDAARI
jgi:hypothetical protein